MEYDFILHPGFLALANIGYYWFINGTNYGSTDDASFEYEFKLTGTSHIEVLVVAKLDKSKNNATTMHKNRILSKLSPDDGITKFNFSSIVLQPADKEGRFVTHVDARNPMTKVEYTGKCN